MLIHMNLIIEFLAEVVDAIGAALSIPANLVLEVGAYLHTLAFVIQNRNNMDENNGDNNEEDEE